MKKITITPADYPVVGIGNIKKPDCIEMHFSESVAAVLTDILDINPRQDGWYPPEKIIERLNRGMDPYKYKMASAELYDKDFRDLVLTLRALAIYAKEIRGFINYTTLIKKDKINEHGPENDPNPYG
jgi:hypothetical protein